MSLAHLLNASLQPPKSLEGLKAPAPGRFRIYPRAELSRPERLISRVVCGFCQEPVIPHGSLAFYDPDLPIEPDSFVLLKEPEQRDFDGYSLKFLRRSADGGLALVSQISRTRLTSQTIVGTLVMLYLPATDPAAIGASRSLDDALRGWVGEEMDRELLRRDQVMAATAARWGKPDA